MWIRTPMLEMHLKSFWCKILNQIESFWHGLYASLLYYLWPLFFGFFFSFFLGFALHNIHAFHSMLFLFSFYKIKNKKIKNKKGKKKQIMFLYYLLSFWKQGWSIYFHITCLLYFVLLCWAYLLHFTSWNFVVHVVCEDVYSF